MLSFCWHLEVSIPDIVSTSVKVIKIYYQNHIVSNNEISRKVDILVRMRTNTVALVIYISNLHYNTHNMEPKLICLLVYHGYHRNVSKDVQFSHFSAGHFNSIISKNMDISKDIPL